MWKLSILVCIAIGMLGCSSASNVYEISPGLYAVTATGDGYTTADRVTDLVFNKAQTHCAQIGKRLQVVDQNQTMTRMGIDTSINLRFRCI